MFEIALMLIVLLTSALLFSPKPLMENPPARDGSLGMPLTTCIAPPVPACIHRPGTYQFKKRIHECQIEVAHQVSALFLWRQCIEADTELTVSRSNREITYFKCRIAHQKNCLAAGK